jgi:iron(II)-dependent oxidoreductase
VVTLPSDAEWERASPGRRDARRYPWGNDWDPNLANGWESGVARVSAVGAFGGGASSAADRIEELSGNVWEWTRSLWRTEWDSPEFGYSYEPDYRGKSRENVRAGEDVLRVVRGGAFLDDLPWDLRSASRYGLVPANRDGYVGFRVVVSPFNALDPLISESSDL